ncbi:hypothetical protein GCM10027418_01290 [Mariniluteicoccus endophyticus]
MNTPDFVLCLYRSTGRFSETLAFLEALGLHRTVRWDSDGSAILWGRRGMVALFDAKQGDGRAPVGQTQLCFETVDLDLARDHLGGLGHRMVVWDDEGEQRSGGLQDPAGRGIFVRESMRDADDRGSEYERHPIDVVAVRESADFATDEAFFGGFGFVRTYGDDAWASLEDPTDGGVIGLHAPWGAPQADGERSPVGAPALVHLGFQTDGDLAPVAERLATAGFAAEYAADGPLEKLVVTDPDGVPVEIHRLA